MNEIKAFVGHSFTEEDNSVVQCFLEYFKKLEDVLPNFSWVHALDAEPKVIDQKVLDLMKGKNVFIGICTKKEQVVGPGIFAPFMRKPWKTSDWIIQEIGVAKGMGLNLVLLIEKGVRKPGELQGNINHIEFNRDSPEKAYNEILEMFRALSPKEPAQVASVTVMPPAPKQPIEQEKEKAASENEVEDLSPKPSWEISRFRYAFMNHVFAKRDDAATALSTEFFASPVGAIPENKALWKAFCQFCLILDGRGNVQDLKTLASENPKISTIWRYLGSTYFKYKDYLQSAHCYEHAAIVASDDAERLSLLEDAVMSRTEGADQKKAQALLEEMKSIVQNRGGESEAVLLKTLVRYGKFTKNNVMVLSALERLVNLDASDNASRFSLAYAHCEAGDNDQGLYHYLRIPASDRAGGTWNNIGAASVQLGLPIKSVEAFRRAEAMGETLAMSNLAFRLIGAGFLPEAKTCCEEAFKKEERDTQVYEAMTRLQTAPEEESNKEKEIIERVEPSVSYLAAYGHALSAPKLKSITARLEKLEPACVLTTKLEGELFLGEGTYEVTRKESSTLSHLFSSVLSKTNETNLRRYKIEYSGVIAGRGVDGQVKITEVDEDKTAIKSLLGYGTNTAKKALMIFSEDGTSCRVMEREDGKVPTFYDLRASSIAEM